MKRSRNTCQDLALYEQLLASERLQTRNSSAGLNARDRVFCNKNGFTSNSKTWPQKRRRPKATHGAPCFSRHVLTHNGEYSANFGQIGRPGVSFKPLFPPCHFLFSLAFSKNVSRTCINFEKRGILSTAIKYSSVCSQVVHAPPPAWDRRMQPSFQGTQHACRLRGEDP